MVKKVTKQKVTFHDIIDPKYIKYALDAPQEVLVDILGYFYQEHKTIPSYYEFANVSRGKQLDKWLKHLFEEFGEDYFIGVKTSKISISNVIEAQIREHREAVKAGVVSENTNYVEDLLTEIEPISTDKDLLLSTDGLIFIDTAPYNQIYVAFHPDLQETIDKAFKNIKKKIEHDLVNDIKDESFMYVLKKTAQGYEFTQKELKFVELEEDLIRLSYGEEFVKFHATVDDFFNKTRDNRGLLLLHGIPGSGKTWYIRDIITKYTNKNIVYIPTTFASYIGTPEFQGLLDSTFKYGSVIIIEDAEGVIIDRDISQHNNVAAILQLTDGLLTDGGTGHKIIATFNTQKDRIDKALLRQGRLFGEHYFGKLSIAEGKALAKYLGKDDTAVTEEMVLADIYDLESFEESRKKQVKEKRAIGFAV